MSKTGERRHKTKGLQVSAYSPGHHFTHCCCLQYRNLYVGYDATSTGRHTQVAGDKYTEVKYTNRHMADYLAHNAYSNLRRPMPVVTLAR